jgi:hypothetical protein
MNLDKEIVVEMIRKILNNTLPTFQNAITDFCISIENAHMAWFIFYELNKTNLHLQCGTSYCDIDLTNSESINEIKKFFEFLCLPKI